VFILKKKIFSRTSRPISIKLGINHPCRGNSNFSNKGPSLLQRGANHKMQKWGGVIEKSSQEPLSQKSSYSHESFPT
jgi:hypothetical protein